MLLKNTTKENADLVMPQPVSNFLQRTQSLLLMLPLAIIALWLPITLKLVVLSFIVSIALYEWFTLSTNTPPRHLLDILGCLTFSVLGTIIFLKKPLLWGVIGGLGLFSIIEIAKQPTLKTLVRILGVSYIALAGGGLAYLVAFLPRQVVLWFLFTVWCTDTGAYLFGKLLKGPKLMPRISPNKTWAGFIGGLTCGMLMTPVFFYCGWLEWHKFSFEQWLAIATGLTLISHMGDMIESLVKRYFKVKDSSRLIPGHGGILDRIDSLLAASLYLYLIIQMS